VARPSSACSIVACRRPEESSRSEKPIRNVVVDVRHTPRYRQRAGGEVDRLPGPELAVELLERLARDKAPIRPPR
jgi:hypothetical protein